MRISSLCFSSFALAARCFYPTHFGVSINRIACERKKKRKSQWNMYGKKIPLHGFRIKIQLLFCQPSKLRRSMWRFTSISGNIENFWYASCTRCISRIKLEWNYLIRKVSLFSIKKVSKTTDNQWIIFNITVKVSYELILENNLYYCHKYS